ncbi:MAG: MFS transporter [Rhodospirillales bacterium]|nr:MFS transporter [Rhodospirillales bacterium]MBT4039000.1 MFS transporter [Rhodospirillales bacterium]MBT4628170.1 MFS transporter [Rhodospirillales bacterium]MBT5353448.1 MFS transporter [Rhodospirillales bacterium]MBT5522148.1 MFS transporter [Rhodospirillales bacterium]
MSKVKGQFAWCLYDWANSSFPTVITTFVFAAYFTKAVSADVTSGTAAWGYAMSLSALTVAFVGPVLGAIVDQGGRRKPWLGFFTAICIMASALLWLVEPEPSFAMMALVLVAVANTAFEIGMVFYNAMLPDLVSKGRLGRLSGWGWGFGYFGGLCCLGLVLVGFVQTDNPWFGLSTENAEHLRITGPVVALWLGVFCLPLFFFCPDRVASSVNFGQAARAGIATLITTIRQVRNYGNIARYLLARMLYVDGLNTLFAFGGIYAAGTFGFTFEELIIFGIAMNVTAGIGAGAFAWVDDRFGSKLVIMVSVSCLSVLGTALLLVETKTGFWIAGLPLGIFVGPAQSAGRTLMARLAPEELRTEMFGLFALSGKATAFLGPALLGWVTVVMDSQRWGMATIIVFFIAGLWVMRGVREEGAA